MTATKTLASLLLSLGVFASTSANAKLCAVLYEHDNYHGSSLIVSDANAQNGWLGDGWNDRATSISVEPGCNITVFEHSDFRGASYTLYGSNSNLGNMWNDQISSYKCSC